MVVVRMFVTYCIATVYDNLVVSIMLPTTYDRHAGLAVSGVEDVLL